MGCLKWGLQPTILSEEKHLRNYFFFLVESSRAVQELQLVMVVETFTCAVLPLKTLPRAAGRASWWLEEGAGRCIEPYGTYAV